MPRILVIDDDKSVRKLLNLMLTRAGYEVVEASNGTEGLSLQKNLPADLVITDVLMPEKDGWDTILELRKECPDVKIMAISGGGKTSPYLNLSLSRQLGADEIMSKPLGKEEFLATVARLLGAATGK